MDILKLIEGLKDDQEVALNDAVKLRVGDLREFANSQATVLANEQKALKAAQTQLQELQQQLAQTRDEAANLIERKLQDLMKGSDQGSGDAWDPFKDPGAFRPLVERIGKLDNALTQATNTMSLFMRRALERDLQSEFSSLPDRPVELTIEGLGKYATEKRYLDPYGIPDLRRAYGEMTAGQRQQKTEEELRAKVEKETREKVRKELEAERQRKTPVTFPGMAGKGGEAAVKGKMGEKVGGRHAIRNRLARDGERVLRELGNGNLAAELHEQFGI